MQLSCVFLPKTGRDLDLIIWSLAPNSKYNVFCIFKVVAYHVLLHESRILLLLEFILRRSPW